MKYVTNKAKIIFTIIFSISVSFAAAQSAEEAYELYQSGVKALEAKNYEAAIDNLNKSVKMYEGVTGLEGTEVIKESAIQGVMQAHYAYGMQFYQDKDFDNALEQFRTTIDLAEKHNNDDLKDRALRYQGSVYNSKASALFNEQKFDDVIEVTTKAIEFSDDNEMAYFWRGRAWDKKNDLDKMKADLDKCIALSSNDPQKAKTVSNAGKIASNAYMSAAVTQIKDKKYAEALEFLNIAVIYPDVNPNAYYYAALSCNALSKWDAAIEAATKALSLELKDTSPTYYELGRAYEGAGKTAEACNAYKKVTSGQSKQAADYQIEHVLKCN
ncbi:MAG: hypothetical protein LBH92_02680 [Bacteroidales bacterium]|jgi:tetratricopeptide (TPR) repeat protein|nr:hypothetical protein [Bacteroidales bacterium]